MAELGQSGLPGAKCAESGPNRVPVQRRTDDLLAGLPAHVMDELVDDMAEAVVAMLLSQAAAQPHEEDDASGDLRQV